MKHYLPTFQTIQTQWKHVLAMPTVREMVIGSLVAIALSLAAIAWWWGMLPPLIPLWYSRAWGEDQLANPLWLWILPGASLGWLAISVSLAGIVSSYSIFSKLILVGTLLVSVLSFITLLQIILLVT